MRKLGCYNFRRNNTDQFYDYVSLIQGIQKRAILKVSKSTIGPRNQAVNRTEKAPQKCSDFFRTVILKNSRTLEICSDPQRKIDWNCAQVLQLKLRQKNHSQKEFRKIKGNLSVFIIEYQINSPTILKRFYFTCQSLLGEKASPLQRRQIDSSWEDCRVSNHWWTSARGSYI